MSAANAASAEKSDSEYWREVGLDFNSLGSMVNNKNCFVGELEFRMCITALEFLLAQATPILALSPAGMSLPQRYGAVVKGFGPIDVVERKTDPSKAATFALEFAKRRRLNVSLQQTWTQIYEMGIRIDFEAVLDYVRQFVPTSDEPSLIAYAFNQAFALADSHSRLEPSARLDATTESNSEKLVGIGIKLILWNDEVFIQEVIAGSPASAAGLMANDVITRIERNSVQGHGVFQVTEAIRGKAGTSVEVTVKRASAPLAFNITRASFILPNVELKLHDTPAGKIAHIVLASFMSEVASEEVGKAILTAEANGAKGIVLDLRGNNGGLMDEAIDIAGHFIGPDRPIMLLWPMDSQEQAIMNVTDKPQLTRAPLIVLVNRESASASELLSGVLQDLRRAYIVGERTFGKGTMQMAFHMGSVVGPFFGKPVVLYRTQATFHTPSGRSNQLHGITPDFEVFYKPDATQAERFALREGDLFPNAVLNPLGAPEKRSVEELRPIEDCLKGKAVARAIFEGRLPSAIPRDYQLLYAVDILNCL